MLHRLRRRLRVRGLLRSDSFRGIHRARYLVLAKTSMTVLLIWDALQR